MARARVRLRVVAAVRGRLHLGQAEVEQLDVAVAGDHHVLRLQIAMDHAALVRAGQHVGHLRRDAQSFLQRNRALQDRRSKRLTLDHLHGDVCDVVDAADVVDGHDVRMIERRGRARFLLEAAEQLRAGHIRRKNLDGHVAIELRIAGLIDLAHTTGADRRHDAVRPESVTGRECQGIFQRIPEGRASASRIACAIRSTCAVKP